MSSAGVQQPLSWQPLDVRLTIKAAVAEALKGCGLSREQVVDRFNEETERAGINYKLSLAILNKWAAPSASHFPPVYLLPILCRITKSSLPLKALAEPLGLLVAGPEEQAAMRAGFALVEKRRALRRYKRAMADLEEIA